MFPVRFSPVLFAFFLSLMMSFLISGLSTFRALGVVDGIFGAWMMNWAVSWATAFPIVLLIAPVVRRLVARLTA